MEFSFVAVSGTKNKVGIDDCIPVGNKCEIGAAA